MESVFVISFCPEDCKVKFAAYALAYAALSRWNRYSKTIGVNIANAMS